MPTHNGVFHPFDGNRIPLEQQFRPWYQQMPFPARTNTDPNNDPYTSARIILMNGIENDAFFFLHNWYRHTSDEKLRAKIAELRRTEVQQQTTVNWLIPPEQTVIDTTISYEQLATDLTANLAQHEPDPYAKQALDYAMIEDFDHLYRYAHLMQLLEGRSAEIITKGQTELAEGRPTPIEHRHPLDTVRRHTQLKNTHIKTALNYNTIVAAEQQTYLFYKSHGFMYAEPLARGLYAEIAEIEEQHVTQYESVPDPTISWVEKAVVKQMNEAYNYYSCWQTETEPRIKAIWEHFYRMELEHIQQVGMLMQQYEKKDITQMFPSEISPLIVLEPNKAYVRQIVGTQRDLWPVGTKLVPSEQLPRDWPTWGYREIVNGQGVPSEQIVERVGMPV